MKNIGKILLFVFFLLCMFLLKPRQDVVFEAIDMSQYIRLFEEDRDFVLCIDANNTYTGTYTMFSDTVFLSYREQVESSMSLAGLSKPSGIRALPEKLFIDEGASLIESADGNLFSAEISLDMRYKAQEEIAPQSDKKANQMARILAFTGKN